MKYYAVLIYFPFEFAQSNTFKICPPLKILYAPFQFLRRIKLSILNIGYDFRHELKVLILS